jgi:hypothetical protein
VPSICGGDPELCVQHIFLDLIIFCVRWFCGSRTHRSSDRLPFSQKIHARQEVNPRRTVAQPLQGRRSSSVWHNGPEERDEQATHRSSNRLLLRQRPAIDHLEMGIVASIVEPLVMSARAGMKMM